MVMGGEKDNDDDDNDEADSISPLESLESLVSLSSVECRVVNFLSSPSPIREEG